MRKAILMTVLAVCVFGLSVGAIASDRAKFAVFFNDKSVIGTSTPYIGMMSNFIDFGVGYAHSKNDASSRTMQNGLSFFIQGKYPSPIINNLYNVFGIEYATISGDVLGISIDDYTALGAYYGFQYKLVEQFYLTGSFFIYSTSSIKLAGGNKVTTTALNSTIRLGVATHL